MTLAEQVKQQVEALPPEKQREVLDFAEFLQQKPSGAARRSVEGLWEGVDITEVQLARARREMWGPYMGGKS